MNDLSPKERLERVLAKKNVDRPPVVCPGGMMNAALVEIMETTGHTLPDGHHSGALMAELAADINTFTGFENFGIPFCMTVEAEVLGSEIDFGTLACEPKIAVEKFATPAAVVYREIPQMLGAGRVPQIGAAAALIASQYPDVPLIGNLTGPVSTAASIVDPMAFFRALRKDNAASHKLMEYVTDFLIAYAVFLIENGAAVISVGDPTATGEILGPKMFAEYAVPYLNKLITGINRTGRPVIVHICGNMNTVRPYIPEIRSQAISTDAMVNLKGLKAEFPQLTTMGNLSTFALEFQEPDKVVRQTQKLLRDKIDIIAPACGLSTSSALANIRALTDTVKEGH